MNTITLTIEATPENLRKLATLLETPGDILPALTKKTEDLPQAPADPTVPEPTAPTIDKTALRELGLKLTKEGKQDALKAALKKFGAAKLSQVKEEDYAALGQMLQEALS